MGQRSGMSPEANGLRGGWRHDLGAAAAVVRRRIRDIEQCSEAPVCSTRGVEDSHLVCVRVNADVRRVLLADHQESYGLVTAVLVTVCSSFAPGKSDDLSFGQPPPSSRSPESERAAEYDQQLLALKVVMEDHPLSGTEFVEAHPEVFAPGSFTQARHRRGLVQPNGRFVNIRHLASLRVEHRDDHTRMGQCAGMSPELRRDRRLHQTEHVISTELRREGHDALVVWTDEEDLQAVLPALAYGRDSDREFVRRFPLHSVTPAIYERFSACVSRLLAHAAQREPPPWEESLERLLAFSRPRKSSGCWVEAWRWRSAE